MFEKLHRLVEYATSEEVASISRRYFTMNGFDGAMTVLGVIIGGLMAGIGSANELRLVLFSGLGSILAIGLSGAAGAFMAEKAERIRRMKELTTHMAKDMKDTEIGRMYRMAPYWTAIVDAASPVITASVTLSPLFLGIFYPEVIPPQVAAYGSIAAALVVLFLLGAYLGKVSKRNLIVSGLKMVVVGGFMIIVLLLTGAV